MSLHIGKKCKWEDIEIGEIFAVNGCWEVHCKTGKNTTMLLADNHLFCFDSCIGKIIHINSLKSMVSWFLDDLYKLPKSVQAFWKVE